MRAKGNSTVRYGNGSMRIDAVAKQLGYTRERQVLCQGRPIQHWIASAPVVLTRPAKPKKIGADGRRQRPVPGEPLKARLVVSRLCDEAGHLVAEWFLLTSVPETVSAARVARWYDFRWQIESFFKLLKQAGHQLEQWGTGERGSPIQASADRHPGLYPGVAPLCAADRGGTSRPAVSRALVRQADEGISPCYPLRLVGWRFHTVRHPRFP
ncbi:hypothetical protein [Thermochromatium tepidum]|uniref:hypothetical protein n=1 Tax=Thermochromatium tepidum TaxID=1050 RepID=UPI0031B5728C